MEITMSTHLDRINISRTNQINLDQDSKLRKLFSQKVNEMTFHNLKDQ